MRNSVVDIYRAGQLNNLAPDQNAPWILNASLDYFGSLPSQARLQFVLSDNKHKIIASGSLSSLNATNSTLTGSTFIDPFMVDLWWPNGLGSQTLYSLCISLTDEVNRTLANITKRVGFRTIVLNETPVTSEELEQGTAYVVTLGIYARLLRLMQSQVRQPLELPNKRT